MKIYIDGQNFLYKASEILSEHDLITDKNDLYKIDLRGMFENIFGKDIDILFFGAKVKVTGHFGDEILQKSKKFSDVARRVRNTLNSQGIKYIEAGKLRVRDRDECKSCGKTDYKFQEKGVDVGLAVKLVYDRLILKEEQQVLVSSDTDLLPAVKVVQDHGGQVCYVGFNNRITKALVSESAKTEIIRDQEIIDAYKRANEKKKK